MQCPQCRHENPPQAKFCLECGIRFALRCSKCGTELPAGAKFCLECGQALSPSSPSNLPRYTSPASYMPKHLAEKILSSKTALEGERKQVTVLFADMKGSMELLADRDPEDARKLLDPVLEHMMEAVHRYEGTVSQVMGDGIMALFGAPLAHEDHAVRACYAALRMQESIKRYAEGVRRAEGIPIQIRVGLNSGEVVVRSIGSDLHMDYTAVGQTTHLAARMEQVATPGSILIAPETLSLAEGYVQAKSLGPMVLKGMEAPIEVYEVIGVSTVRSRLHAAAIRGLTRFVGRDAEMEQLQQTLERARTGHGQVVAVVGEPGVGKSRLLWEFTHSHRTEGWLVLESGSASYGQATSYLPLIDLLRMYFQIEPRDDPRKIREKVTGKVLTLDEALRPMLVALLALLEVPVEEAEWRALDPPQRRQRTLQALRHLVLHESHVQPLCLVFEDLHWIDSETQAFLDGLVESLPTARMFLLVNYRPEYQHGWGNKTYYTQLSLNPLAPVSAAELLSASLGPDPGLEPLKQFLIGRTEGNPFFLEESVRTLVETKALVGERGAYRLGTALPNIQVPPTVQVVLAARIDRLPAEDKRLVQCASVSGETVPFVILQLVTEMPEEALRQGLSRLQSAEFLYETRLFPDLEYTFKHGLTYQVAYNSLLHQRRSALHAKNVEAIEALYPDRLTEHVEKLAHHALRGEVWEKAVPYLRQAGAKALARSASREAAISLDAALAALQHLPETRERSEQAIDLRFDLRNALWGLGAFEKLLDHLRDAERVAKTLGDPRRLAWVSAYMSASLWITGHAVEARPFGESALTIAKGLEDLALQIVATFYLATSYVTSGDYRRGEELLLNILQTLGGDRSRERCGLPFFPAALSLSWLSCSLTERGEFGEAMVYAREGVRMAEAVDHAFTLAHCCFHLGYLHAVKGEFSLAVRTLERSAGLCRDSDLALLLPVAAGFLGHAYALSGQGAQGVALLEQSLEAFESIGRAADHARVLSQLGESYLLAGRLEDALGAGERALTHARERAQRGYQAWALRLLGEIVAHGDPANAETAEEHYRQALVLADELEMRPLVAHCHLGVGKLYRHTGNQQEAQKNLTTAMVMYREMDMGFWLEKAEARGGTKG